MEDVYFHSKGEECHDHGPVTTSIFLMWKIFCVCGSKKVGLLFEGLGRYFCVESRNLDFLGVWNIVCLEHDLASLMPLDWCHTVYCGRHILRIFSCASKQVTTLTMVAFGDWYHGWISPLAFTMAMEVIIQASKWVVGNERLQDGTQLPPIQAFMDNMTTLTTTAPCTRPLLAKLNDNLKWARMKPCT